MKRAAFLAGLALAGCDRDRSAPSKEPGGGAPAGPSYRIDVDPPAPCRAGEACAVRVRVVALDPYKVNRDYPFRFTAEPSPGVTADGDPAFTFDDAKTGTLTFRFRAAAAGPARITGSLKLSVCSDDDCDIEEAPIAVDVPIS
jgi:hypothetical protein